MRIIILTISALILTTHLPAAELDEATRQQLFVCLDGDYKACDKVFDYFLAQRDMPNTALVADYMCLDKEYKNLNSRIAYCSLAGQLYLIDEGNPKKALPRLKVGCAAANENATDIVGQSLSSTCAMVAAIENDFDRLDEELELQRSTCTDSLCLFNLAVAVAVAGRFDRAIDYIEKVIKAGNNSRTDLIYFNKYPQIKRSKKYQTLIKKFTK